MFYHHLLTALLHIKQNKLYAALNIAGLSVALCAALLIALFVRDELIYEHWIPDYDRIYRVSGGPIGGRTSGAGPSDLRGWLELDFPQIDAVTRFFNQGGSLRHEETVYNVPIAWADANFFDVFQFPVVAGNLKEALVEPNSLVLSETAARSFFGDANPVGEILLFNQTHPMTVTAVIEDLPRNTHLNFRILASSHAEFSPAAAQDRSPMTAFGQKLWNSNTYIHVGAATAIEEIRKGMPEMLDRRTPVHYPNAKPSEVHDITVMPIADIHLSPLQPDGRTRDLSQILTVSAIGLLIVLGASVNFINMMTARGIARAREIGVRKTLGAKQSGLVVQFLTESLLYVLIGAVLACMLAAACMSPFNAFLQREISLEVLSHPVFLGGAFLVLVLVGVLAGLYPALALSSYPAGVVLRAGRGGKGAGLIRQSLSFIQFTILIALIIGTVAINRQMQFGVAEALRLNSDPIINVTTPCIEPFRNAVLALPGVRGAACSVGVVQFGIGPGSGMSVLGEQGRNAGVRYASVDEGYFELFGIEAAAGRFFDRDRSSDFSPEQNVWTVPEAIVINETAARTLGFQSMAEAVGQRVVWSHYFRISPTEFSPPHEAEIIGVVEDFQFGSIRNGILPAVFYMDPRQGQSMSIRIDGQQLPETLAAIDQAWSELGEPRPIARNFYDQAIENLYRELRTQGQLLAMYAGVAIFIAMLGMVGLAAFVTQRRTKEIGVRKVLGGTRKSIVSLLLWQFAKPVIWANLAAWPAAWYFLNVWLQGFARRIDLEPWMFLGPSILALLLALATVLSHAWLISGADPAKVLSCE